MTSFIETIDNLVSAAQAFCTEPSLCSAVEFHAYQHRVFQASIALKLEPWSVIRAVAAARHPVGSVDDVKRASARSRVFLEPVKLLPANSGSGSGSAVPVRSRYQNQR
jgi:hypothetical protein